jgi:hypothetical protein
VLDPHPIFGEGHSCLYVLSVAAYSHGSQPFKFQDLIFRLYGIGDRGSAWNNMPVETGNGSAHPTGVHPPAGMPSVGCTHGCVRSSLRDGMWFH